MTSANKETLNLTVFRNPVVKVVAIGEEGLAAVELMMTEGIEGVRFVCYDLPHVTDESITTDLLGANRCGAFCFDSQVRQCFAKG